MNFKNDFADIIFDTLNRQVEKKKLILMIGQPKFKNMGDMDFPCFELAKNFSSVPAKYRT